MQKRKRAKNEYDPILVTVETLRGRMFDNLTRQTAEEFVDFAEARVRFGMDRPRSQRVNLRKVQEAADFCCRHPEALLTYKNMSEARAAIG